LYRDVLYVRLAPPVTGKLHQLYRNSSISNRNDFISDRSKSTSWRINNPTSNRNRSVSWRISKIDISTSRKLVQGTGSHVTTVHRLILTVVALAVSRSIFQ
jgi:hypothetical protein